jgi:hypothetical protein
VHEQLETLARVEAPVSAALDELDRFLAATAAAIVT